MFTLPPICRLGQPGHDGTCVMCCKVLYDDEDEEAQDEEMMECQDCGASIHWDCLEPPIMSIHDGVFCPKCIKFRPEQTEYLLDMQGYVDELRELRKIECMVCKIKPTPPHFFEGFTLLLCDGEGCNKACHLGCLNPPLRHIPSGLWFCPLCQQRSHNAVARRHEVPMPTTKSLRISSTYSVEVAEAAAARQAAAEAAAAACRAAAASAAPAVPCADSTMQEEEEESMQYASDESMQYASEEAMLEEDDDNKGPAQEEDVVQVDLYAAWSSWQAFGGGGPAESKGKEAAEEQSLLEEEMEEEEAHEPTVNGIPLAELLANGIAREDLVLDTELENTLPFPSGLSSTDEVLVYARVLHRVYIELRKLFDDHFIDIFPANDVEEMMEMYHDGSLFDILGETLPWQLIALTLNLRLLGPVEVGDPEHWLSEFDAERIFQDWARETWGQENPYCATYQSGGFPCWDVFDKEQQLIMIYNLLDCVIMECYSKPLHLIPGVVVTPEYWFESFEIVESGFEGGDAEGAQHAMPPGARAQQEGPADAAVPPPLPPRPRRVQARQVTRWSGLTAKEIVDDLVELKVVHYVNTAYALKAGSSRYPDTEATRNKGNKPGEFINKVWGPVAERMNLPILSKQRVQEVWKEIQKLPQALREGNYPAA